MTNVIFTKMTKINKIKQRGEKYEKDKTIYDPYLYCELPFYIDVYLFNH